MGAITSQITSLTIVYSTVYSDADRRKHQSSASLAFVWVIHRDRWIPRTKGQLRGKCFHLMTSSCTGVIKNKSTELLWDAIRWSYDVSLMASDWTHRGPDKMATILQTTFSNACYVMEMHGIRLRFHWSLLLRVQLVIFLHWFRLWLGAGQATLAIVRTNNG